MSTTINCQGNKKYAFPSVKKPMQDSDDILNILLIGQSGVGKSTFINGFANCIKYSDYSLANSNELLVIVPIKMTVFDDENEEKLIIVGNNSNEKTEIGKSSTISCMSYIFTNRQGQKIRLIDTPGAGDDGGLENDKIKIIDIIKHISRVKVLKGICFLLKPDQAILDPYFEYCIENLFGRLDASASKNVIFVFTRCQKVGQTLSILRRKLDQMKETVGVTIPCQKNIFCVENDPIIYLIKSKEGICIAEDEVMQLNKTWKFTSESYNKIINYINANKETYNTSSSVALEDARSSFIAFETSLKKISEYIQHKIQSVNETKENLKNCNIKIENLQNDLENPSYRLKIVKLRFEQLICNNCAKDVTVNGQTETHYQQICQEFVLPLGMAFIRNRQAAVWCCKSFGWNGKCTVCKCSYKEHDIINFKTEAEVDTKFMNELMHIFNNEQNTVGALQKVILKLEESIKNNKEELVQIMDCMVIFYSFHQQNSLVGIGDSFLMNLSIAIDREELKSKPDLNYLKQLKSDKELYMKIKTKYEYTAKEIKSPMSSTDVSVAKETLFNLPENGKQIREMYESLTDRITSQNDTGEETDCSNLCLTNPQMKSTC